MAEPLRGVSADVSETVVHYLLPITNYCTYYQLLVDMVHGMIEVIPSVQITTLYHHILIKLTHLLSLTPHSVTICH